MPRKFKTNRTYVIIDLSDVKTGWFNTAPPGSKFLQTSIDTLRKNVAGDRVILKYITPNGKPTVLNGKPSAVFYTHEEVLDHIANPANGWVHPPD